jgi:HTH-type transcriptional regulator, competence development regulator
MEVNTETLRTLREERVLTVSELARQAGVSKNTISKAENGGSVYPSTVRKLAQALGVDPSDLVGKRS